VYLDRRPVTLQERSLWLSCVASTYRPSSSRGPSRTAEPAAELCTDESLPVDPELSEGVSSVKLAPKYAIELLLLGSDLGMPAGPPPRSYAPTAKSGTGVSLSVFQSLILVRTLWKSRRVSEGPCIACGVYALSRRPLPVTYSESCTDIAAEP
jgi:hypothetical protein